MNRLLHFLTRNHWPRRLQALRLSREEGASYILLALMLPMLIGFVGLVIDVGAMFEVRRELQTSVDAGALAGAQRLPYSPGDATAIAQDYVNRNRESQAATTITIGTTYVANDTITVSAVRNVPLLFMPVLGHANLEDVAATATALVGTLNAGECVLPLGVVDENSPGPGDGYGYTYGERVVLKVGAEGNLQGNFQALAIYGPGGDNFADGIAGDNCNDVYVYSGQSVPTLPGNKIGNILDGFNRRIASDSHSFAQVVAQQPDGTALLLEPDCPRLVVVPIVDTLDVNGTKPVTILGFAHFFIESYTYIPPGKMGGNGHYEVIGRYIDILTSGPGGAYSPTGARVVRLIR